MESFIWRERERECQTVHLSFSLGSPPASHPPGPHSRASLRPTSPRKSTSFCMYQINSAGPIVKASSCDFISRRPAQTCATLSGQKPSLKFQHKCCSFAVTQQQPHKSAPPAPDWELGSVVFTAALPLRDPHRPFAWTTLLSRGSRATPRRGGEHMCGRSLTAAVTFA